MKFPVPGKPVPKARPRVVNGRAFTPQRTKNYEKLVALHAKAAMARERWDYDGNVRVVLGIEKHQAEVTVEPSQLERFGKADIDNIFKAVADGLEKAGVFDNDRRVVEMLAYFKESK